jgi:hypothetical protein
MLGGGGLSASASSSASGQGGTQGGTESSFSPNFYSPFAVGPNASATATGAPGGSSTILWVVGIAAVAAVGIAAFSALKK